MSDKRILTTFPGLVLVPTYPKPATESMTVARAKFSPEFKVRPATRVKSESRTLTTLAGVVMVPK